MVNAIMKYEKKIRTAEAEATTTIQKEFQQDLNGIFSRRIRSYTSS